MIWLRSLLLYQIDQTHIMDLTVRIKVPLTALLFHSNFVSKKGVDHFIGSFGFVGVPLGRQQSYWDFLECRCSPAIHVAILRNWKRPCLLGELGNEWLFSCALVIRPFSNSALLTNMSLLGGGRMFNLAAELPRRTHQIVLDFLQVLNSQCSLRLSHVWVTIDERWRDCFWELDETLNIIHSSLALLESDVFYHI